MNTDRVEDLLTWFASSGLETLEISDASGAITLRAPRSVAPVAAPLPLLQASAPTTGDHPVLSPLFGVCYLAPHPDAPPFVSVGSRIKAGDPVCVIEAMKVMNTVTAPIAGTVTRIHASDGTEVEEGTVLFDIAPEAVS